MRGWNGRHFFSTTTSRTPRCSGKPANPGSSDPDKRYLASANFVFHGPEYFGVTDDDKEGAKSYALIDTVSLTSKLMGEMAPGQTNGDPIALAIAGYGAGKSHYALTLANLLSAPTGPAAGRILNNIEHASPDPGKQIRSRVENWERPFLVLPINGMTDFNLAEELSRQVLVQLRSKELDTTPVEDLWPRFQDAETFVERNFDRWRTEFQKVFGPDVEDLKKAKKTKDVPEIDKAIAKLTDFQKACKAKRKQHRNRSDAFFDRAFSTIEDIRAAHIEVRDLMAIFSGEEIDIDELNKMEKRLAQFEQDFSYLNDLSKPESDLRQYVEEKIRQIHSEEEKDEDLPLWRDAEDIYGKFMERVLADRKNRSNEWLKNVLQPQDRIQGMDAAGCQRLLSRLEAAPIYITEEDQAKIEEMKTAIQRRLGDLKVEGLLVQFRRLPQELKREFYKIIASEV